MKRCCRIVLITLLTTLPAWTASAAQDAGGAGDTPEAQRIAELEAENQRLREELAELRMRLNELLREREARRDDDRDDEAMPDDAPDRHREPNGDGDGEEDAEDARTFDSLDQILRTIPREHEPDRFGWDLVHRVAVEEWLAEEIPGSRFEARLQVLRVRVRYDEAAEDWTVTIHFERREARYKSWGVDEIIPPVVLRGDNGFADRARNIRARSRVNVSATIVSADWGPVVGQKDDDLWKPLRVQLNLEDIEVHSPHLRR